MVFICNNKLDIYSGDHDKKTKYRFDSYLVVNYLIADRLALAIGHDVQPYDLIGTLRRCLLQRVLNSVSGKHVRVYYYYKIIHYYNI